VSRGHAHWYEVRLKDAKGFERSENFAGIQLIERSLRLSFNRDPKGIPHLIPSGGGNYEIRQGMQQDRYFKLSGGEVIGTVTSHSVSWNDDVAPL
jgi:hypothetical protein